MLKKIYLNDKILWLVFGIFVLITFWGLINHAPWRDEAQSWLLVRDLNLPQLINQLPYEGTPPLWHLIIFPFAKLGLPYASELIIHYLIALTLIFIFLFASPLPKKIKVLIPFTYYFLFEYAIVARNYSLTALLLFLIAALYKKRFDKPLLYGGLVFLLSWTNIHSLAISIVLSAIFIYEIIKHKYEQNQYLLASTIMLTGILSTFLILIPHTNQYSNFVFSGWGIILTSLGSALLPFNKADYPLPIMFLGLLSALWVPFLVLILKTYQSRIIFFFSGLWLIFIFTFKNGGYLRHYGLILIFFIFAWWLDIINKENKINLKYDLKYKITLSVFLLCLIFNILYAGYFYSNNHNKYFSGAKEMAEYLKANNLENDNIATYPSYAGSALLPYLPGTTFYQMETMKVGTYLTWDKTFFNGEQTPYYILKQRLIQFYKKDTNLEGIYLLTSISGDENPDLKLITKTSRATVKKDEFFYLYWLQFN